LQRARAPFRLREVVSFAKVGRMDSTIVFRHRALCRGGLLISGRRRLVPRRTLVRTTSQNDPCASVRTFSNQSARWALKTLGLGQRRLGLFGSRKVRITCRSVSSATSARAAPFLAVPDRAQLRAGRLLEKGISEAEEFVSFSSIRVTAQVDSRPSRAQITFGAVTKVVRTVPRAALSQETPLPHRGRCGDHFRRQPRRSCAR